MKTTAVVFDEAASRHGRQPLFMLTFVNHPIVLTSFPPAAGQPQRWDLIKEVGAVSGNIKPDEGQADVSSLTLKVVDDERFHQLLPLLAREDRVQLKGGFVGLPEADWPILITGLLDGDIALDTNLGIWNLRINDLKFYTIKSGFRVFGKTKLNGALASGATTATVDSTDGSATAEGDKAFHDPAVAPVNGWIKIDDEVIAYTGMTPTTFTGLVRGSYRQCGGSAASGHDDDAEVCELFVLEGNPIELMLSLLTSTGTGLNGAYDLWEADQGLGIDDALIDIAGFEEARDFWFLTDTYRFILKEKIDDVKEFLEKEILKTINAYLIHSGDGIIALRVYNPPFAADPADLLEAEISDLNKWDRGLDKLINNTIIQYDHNIIDNEFKTQRYDLNAPSINKHGLSPSWKLECKGLWTDLYSDTIIDKRVARLFTRYADGPVGFSARVTFDKFKWEAADIVAATLSRVPDLARGVRGVTDAWMEIVSCKADPAKGQINLDLVDTHLAGKYGMIAPDAYPNYFFATDAERRCAYICDTVTELMSNGDAPSLII